MTTLTPLKDVVVTELGGRIGAGVCGSMLAQLGATVIVPEGMHGEGGKQRLRAQLMAGKLSVTLEERSSGDDEFLDRVIARSDVLILSSDVDGKASFYPGWIADTARVVCNVTAYGDSGSLAGTPHTEAQVQALSGILDTTGPAETPPTPIRLPLLEFMTGIYAAVACQAALRVLRRGDGGQLIDMALYDCAFSAMSTFLAKPLSGDDGDVGRLGNRHSMAAPWNIYRADDGWLLICAASDDQWRRITEVIARPELALDARYLRVADRLRRSTEIDEVMQTWVGRNKIARCLDAFAAAGIPSGPVTKVDGWPREANLQHRRMIRSLREPLSGRGIYVPASPLRMTASPGQSPERIPAPDADREKVARLATGVRKPPALAPTRTTDHSGALPLAGVRVIEIGHYTTAPLSARHLANLGADVIKIEPPGGEAVRPWAPAKKGTGYFFTYTNSDKRSLALDLETEQGVSIFRDLIARSDVLLENLKPGALAKRGFSPEAIRSLNPRLVYCAVSGFGADSIYGGRPAFDSVIQAMSGVMDLTRSGDVPVKTGVSCADIIAAEMAVVAVLGALDARDRNGTGQYIDLSMQDIAAWATMPLWNEASTISNPFVLKAKDGFVVIDPKDRNGVADLPKDLAQGAAEHMIRAELVKILSESGWQAAPVLSVHEMLDSSQTRARKLVFTACDRDGEPWPLLASPLRLKGTPPQVHRPMSALGRDGAAILAELGRSASGPNRQKVSREA